MNKGLLFLSLIFLVAVLSASVKADFTITTNLQTNTVCPSSTIVVEDVVSGTSGAYSVTIGGTAANFATTVPQGFWLDPENKQVIYSYLTPSSKITPGNYILEVTVASGGIVKTVKHNIIVENCHFTTISVEPKTQSACACDKKSLALKITNSGKFLENYDISVEGPASSWTTLSAKSISLAPNASTIVTAYVTSPCNAKGDYDINFVVKAKSEYSEANAKATVNIIQCYDYSISSEKTFYSICEADKLTVPVKIKNLGTQNNTYKINLYAPNWTNADLNQMTLGAGKEGTFNLISQPPYKTQGNFTANIEVLSQYGQVLKKHSISYDVGKCFNVLLTIESAKDKMCNSLSNTYSVVVKNTGKFTNTYDLSIDGPEWVTISERRITLNASKEKSLTLDVHPSSKTPAAAYTIKVKATDAVSKASSEAQLVINTVSLDECYKPAITTKDNVIQVSRDSTATAIFLVENKGTKDANYTVEISGTGTKFSQINPGTVSIKSGKAQTLYLYIAPPLDTQLENYTVTVTARLKDTTILAAKTVTISVLEAGKIPSQKLNQTINQTVQPVQSFFSKIISWIVNAFTYKPQVNQTNATINKTKTNVTKTNQTQTNQTTNKTTTNHAPVLSKKIPDISMKTGESKSIDLNDYFTDADKNDELTYVAVKPLNISVALAGSKVTIEPGKFIGTREITFYASDGKDLTQSNIVKITSTESTTTSKTTNKTNATNQSDIKITQAQSLQMPSYLIWIIVGLIVIAIILYIIFSGTGKKVMKFFEEEPTNGKKNNNK